MWISIVPASFGEKMILSLLNCLGTLVEDQVTVASIYSLTAILCSVKLLSPSKSHFFFICELQQYQGHGPWLGCFEDPVR